MAQPVQTRWTARAVAAALIAATLNVALYLAGVAAGVFETLTLVPAGRVVFGWIAGVALLLSFAAPLAMPAWTRPQILLLEVMHVVVAAPVWTVVRIGEREAA
ncbi:MAG: hypothetical protein KY467_15265 [Gemmatimonadetes bacterium]|nr:hypothetical protein [Gemmatimonadota bacterium]